MRVVQELADDAVDGLAGSVWKGTGVIEVVRSGSLPRAGEIDVDLVVSGVQTGCEHSTDAVDQIDFVVLSSEFAPLGACALLHVTSVAVASKVLGETI